MSCPAPGDCVAAGEKVITPNLDGNPYDVLFVATETDGTWNAGQLLAGCAVDFTNAATYTEVSSISCGAVGNCSLVGYYHAPSNTTLYAIVANETDGVWGAAKVIPGTVLSSAYSQTAWATSISCSGVGDCSAGGYYLYGSDGLAEPFVVTETNGTWGNAEVPGLGAFSVGPNTWMEVTGIVRVAGQLRCHRTVHGRHGSPYEFVVNEKNGAWETPRRCPAWASQPGLRTAGHQHPCGGSNLGGSAAIYVTCDPDDLVRRSRGLHRGGAYLTSVSPPGEAWFTADETDGSGARRPS